MADPVFVTFLGGLGEIGRNCAVIETAGRRVLLDCGRMFAGDELPGVDSVIPDFDWLLEAGSVDACIATHAHEDHIGALPYLLEHLSFPVYGSAFTLGIVRHKLQEAGLLDRCDLRVLSDGDRFTAGPFECEALPVTHSVPGGLITCFYTPQGVILHSSDFKLDLTPVDGRRTALARIGALATEPGVRLLLADSTNADAPGSSSSEREIGAVLADVIARQHGRRVIVSAFASHIHRIQQVVEAAVGCGRTVATMGLSMRRNVSLARELGLLRVPDAAMCDIADVEGLDPGRTLIVCTGSQGEPFASLSQLAEGNSKWLTIGEQDTVIFSSHPIPGNEAAVSALRNDLTRRGAQVLHTGNLELHTSGHGKQQELRVLHSVASPQWFVPVHGEYHHLVAHASLAREMGTHEDRVLLCVDGDRVELSDDGLTLSESVGGDHVYVDGTVGDLGAGVIGERRKLADSGVVTVSVAVDSESGTLLADPEVASRGWVEPPALAEHESAVADAVDNALAKALRSSAPDLSELTALVHDTARRASRERTRRRPVIVPIVQML